MKLKTLVGIVTLGMIVTLCKAELTEQNARQALDEQVQKMEFRVADGAPAMTNLAGLGGPANRVVEVSWQKPRKQKIEDEEWTVFVADALVETYHGKYRVKAGVGLQQKGDDVFMCEAFDPVIQRVQPTPQEEEAMKKESERQQRVDSALGKVFLAKWNRSPRDLGNGLSVSIVFATGADGGGRMPLGLEFVQSGKKVYFPLAYTQEELVQVNGFLNKFSEWAKVAASKHVESYRKDIGKLDFADYSPSTLFTFLVDEKGKQSLQLSYPSSIIELAPEQAEHLALIVAALPSELIALVKEAESEGAKQANSTAEKDALFK